MESPPGTTPFPDEPAQFKRADGPGGMKPTGLMREGTVVLAPLTLVLRLGLRWSPQVRRENAADHPYRAAPMPPPISDYRREEPDNPSGLFSAAGSAPSHHMYMLLWSSETEPAHHSTIRHGGYNSCRILPDGWKLTSYLTSNEDSTIVMPPAAVAGPAPACLAARHQQAALEQRLL